MQVGGKPAVLPQPSYRIDALLAEPLQDLPEFFNAAVPPGSPGSIVGNLAFRNLKRGQLLRLPSGQAVSRALGIAPLSDEILWGAGSRIPLPEDGDADLREALEQTTEARRARPQRAGSTRHGAPLKGNAPLWYYILREAEYYGATEPSREGSPMGGQHLGPVGSRHRGGDADRPALARPDVLPAQQPRLPAAAGDQRRQAADPGAAGELRADLNSEK